MTKVEARRVDTYHNGDKTVVVGVRITIEELAALDRLIENSDAYDNRSEAFRYWLETAGTRKR